MGESCMTGGFVSIVVGRSVTGSRLSDGGGSGEEGSVMSCGGGAGSISWVLMWSLELGVMTMSVWFTGAKEA